MIFLMGGFPNITERLVNAHMKQRTASVEAYFMQKIEGCEAQYRTLWSDDRTDEAAFQKVRANVYDIFRTILSVAVKTKGHDPEAVKIFFLEKTEQIPANWVKASTLAQTHADAKRVCIEQIKLDTIQEIRTVFLRIWEGRV